LFSLETLEFGCIVLLQCHSLQKIRGANSLQRYAWPAVFQGSDVVGVSQSGKTVSYLLPLSFTLQHKGSYSNLPRCGIGVSSNI